MHTISQIGIMQVDEVLREAVERQLVPGVTAVIANQDRILYDQALGAQDLANHVGMRRDTIFRIASMTKPLTSVAIMLLHERGKLDLDEPAARFIPQLRSPQVFASFNQEDVTYTSRPAANDITIRHLLNHTSGYGYAFSNPTLYALEQATGQEPIELPLLHDPGAQWTYGISTAILGDVICAITGKRLYAFLESEILTPLGMVDTFYEVPTEKRTRVATYHQRQQGQLVEVPNPQHISYPESGSGGLLSTGLDYLCFLQMLLNKGAAPGNRLLQESSVELMIQNQIGDLRVEIQPAADASKCRPFMLKARRDKFGLGFQLAGPRVSRLPLRSPGSYSWAGLYNTYFWVDPQQELIAILLLQMLPFYDTVCRDLCTRFEKAIYRHCP